MLQQPFTERIRKYERKIITKRWREKSKAEKSNTKNTNKNYSKLCNVI